MIDFGIFSLIFKLPLMAYNAQSSNGYGYAFLLSGLIPTATFSYSL